MDLNVRLKFYKSSKKWNRQLKCDIHMKWNATLVFWEMCQFPTNT